MIKRLFKKAVLCVCFLSIFSCSDMINEKYGFKIPDSVVRPDAPSSDDDGGNGGSDDDGGNGGADDDLPADGTLDKFDISFDGDDTWHWHWFPDEEFWVEKSLTEPLDCLTDCIEFTIKGTTNHNVTGLCLQLHNVDGEIVSYHIPERFIGGEPFEKTLEVPLSSNYNPNKDTWFNLCYDTGSDWLNMGGLEILDFSISARGVRNCGFKFFKNVWNSNINTDFNYQHYLRASTFMDNRQTNKYLNLNFVCDSPEEIYNLRAGLYTSSGIYREYRICELIAAENRIELSIPIDASQQGTKLENITFSYDTQDVNYAIICDFFRIDDLESSDSAKYTIIDPNYYKDLRTKLFPQDSYSLENGTLTIKDSRALENITYNTNFWEGTGINRYDVDTIIISEGITEIPANSFWNCHNVTSIILPSTLTSIYKDAFYQHKCSYIKIPCNVTVLDEDALCGLEDCVIEFDWPSYDTTSRSISDDFTGITDPITVYNDGKLYDFEYLYRNNGVSWYCNSDKTLYVYGEGTIDFVKKTNWKFDDITKIVFTTGITGIYYTAVPDPSLAINCNQLSDYLPNLSSIVLPETLNYIYSNIFSNLTIPEITIPSSVFMIDSQAFDNWTSSQTIHLDWPSTDTTSRSISPNSFGSAQVYYNDGVKYQ